MKHLIVDHFRRWAKVLAAGAIFILAIGWFIAVNPSFTFDFWLFLAAMWTGAQLLQRDFQHGLIRVMATMPVRPAQIGRAWWLATVPLPSVAASLLLFSGAILAVQLQYAKVLPVRNLALASLFFLLWQGVLFTMISAQLLVRKGWEGVRSYFWTICSIIVFFGGFLYFQNASTSSFKTAVLLGAGSLMLVESWLRSNNLVEERLRFRLTAIPAKRASQHCAPKGVGGIPFLLRAAFVPSFLYLAFIFGTIAFLLRNTPMHVTGIGAFMACWFILLYQFTIFARALRYLRTLPISATRLAATLIALPILPLFALCTLAGAVIWFSRGTASAINFLQIYSFTFAAAAMCVFFLVWLGAGKQGFIAVILTLVGLQQVPFYFQLLFPDRPIQINVVSAAVTICLVTSFLLTRRVLTHSSHAYRLQPLSLQGSQLGVNR